MTCRVPSALAIMAFVAMTASPSMANPKEDTVAAQQNFEAGAELYAAGDYLGAWRHFERAYELAPRPELRFSAAQALRLQHSADGDVRRLELALSYYREYLQQAKTGGRRAEAARYIKEIELLLAMDPNRAEGDRALPSPKGAQLTILAPAKNARASLDGRALMRLPASIPVSPGVHRIRIAVPGHRIAERRVAIERDQLLAVDIPIEPLPARVTVKGRDAEVYVDGRKLGVAPLHKVELAAGRHRFAIGRQGHVAVVESVELGRGETHELEADLSVSAQRIASWVLLAAGAGAAVAAGTLVGLAVREEESAVSLQEQSTAEGRAMNETEREVFNEALHDRNDYRLAAAIAGGSAALLLLSGALLYLFDDPDLEARSGTQAIEVSPSSLRVRF